MPGALDFSPLDGPLAAGEARTRRRSLLAGRSALTEISPTQLFAFVFLACAWLFAPLGVVAVVMSTVGWLVDHGPTPDFLTGAPLLIGGAVVVMIVLVALTRLAIIPPRWGRWVRMQRFADANGLVFIRRATRDDLGSGVDGPVTASLGGATGSLAGVGLLSDAFLDPSTGIVVGNSGEGLGRQGFVFVPRNSSALAEDASEVAEYAPGVEPLRGFDLVSTPSGRLGLRHRAVGRSSAALRALFATADAVVREEQHAIR